MSETYEPLTAPIRLLKTLSSKAEPTDAPEAYPLGYVEDAFKARTPLDGVFSSRQNRK